MDGATGKQRTRAASGVGIVSLLLTLLALAACSPATGGVGSTGASASTATAAASATAGSQPAAPCQANQLASQLRAGGYGTGNDLGEILIRNASASPCSLQGAVDFYGVDAQGARIAASKLNQPQTLTTVVLPPNTPAAAPGAEPAAGAYLVMPLLGAYRDDPNAPNGLCSAANEVTPARFVVTAGSVTVQVVNNDPSGSQFKSMYGCHGRILGEGLSLSS